MVGINDQTGKWIEGFGHVVQSLGIIFTTSLATRVMRRTFGSLVPSQLGRSMSAPLILRFKTAVIVAIELWEPRYRVTIVYDSTQDSRAEIRSGKLSFAISGQYRPRGHRGDPTPEEREVVISMNGGTGALAVG